MRPHEHRTIPQRLGDHDALLAELLARIERLEQQPKTRSKPDPSSEQVQA